MVLPRVMDEFLEALQKTKELEQSNNSRGLRFHLPELKRIIEMNDSSLMSTPGGQTLIRNFKAALEEPTRGDAQECLDKFFKEIEGYIEMNTSNQKSTNIGNISIDNSNVQIGDNNVQAIQDGLKVLVENINKSNSTEQEKDEAKGKIRGMLKNPTIAAVLGGAASGFLSLL